MQKLNLTATNKPQELILAYLQENASDILAEKINSGTPFEKDGKQLVNRKDLDGFMKYANDEARKLAEKGANSACVEDGVVYGWAIHYFEEDSIQGKLYNPDGTEYTPPKPITKTAAKPTIVKPVEPPKPKQQQATLFDMLDAAKAQDTVKPTVKVNSDEDEPTPEETQEILAEKDEEEIETTTVKDSPSVEEIADSLQKAVDEKHGIKQEPKKELPPFYVQYVDMKSMHKDEIVLARLGDFYEAFDDDATVLSDELNLTLTGRNVGLENRVSMVGFPYHVADNYIAKIRNNHGVVIIEDNGNVVTLGKVVKADGKAVDTDTGEILDEIEELTESEMREFDGDIQEPKAVDDEPMPYSTDSFDKETIIYLYDLLDGKLEIA